MQKDYRYNKKEAEKWYRDTQEKYPNHAVPAHELAVRYLKKYDKRRLRIFLGETADPKNEAYWMHNAHYLIADILHQKDLGNPAVTPENLDFFARRYLQLPFATIEGGKK